MEDICGDNSLKDDSNEVGVVDEVPHADPDPDQEEFEKVNAQREADKIELNIKQNSDVKKALKENSNDEYEVKLMSEKEDQPYDQKQGYKFSGDNLLFVNGLKDIEKHLKMNVGETLVIDGIKIKIMSFNKSKSTCSLIIYGGIGLDDKRVALDIFANSTKDEKCMLVKRCKGGSIQHAHLAMEVFRWLLNKYLEGEINEKKWKSFVLSKNEKNRKCCHKCGKVFTTKQGPLVHADDCPGKPSPAKSVKRSLDSSFSRRSLDNSFSGASKRPRKPYVSFATKPHMTLRSSSQTNGHPASDKKKPRTTSGGPECGKCKAGFKSLTELNDHKDKCNLDQDKGQALNSSPSSGPSLPGPVVAATSSVSPFSAVSFRKLT